MLVDVEVEVDVDVDVWDEVGVEELVGDTEAVTDGEGLAPGWPTQLSHARKTARALNAPPDCAAESLAESAIASTTRLNTASRAGAPARVDRRNRPVFLFILQASHNQ